MGLWYLFGTDCCVLSAQIVQKPRHHGRSGRSWKHLHVNPLGWGPERSLVQIQSPRLNRHYLKSRGMLARRHIDPWELVPVCRSLLAGTAINSCGCSGGVAQEARAGYRGQGERWHKQPKRPGGARRAETVRVRRARAPHRSGQTRDQARSETVRTALVPGAGVQRAHGLGRPRKAETVPDRSRTRRSSGPWPRVTRSLMLHRRPRPH